MFNSVSSSNLSSGRTTQTSLLIIIDGLAICLHPMKRQTIPTVLRLLWMHFLGSHCCGIQIFFLWFEHSYPIQVDWLQNEPLIGFLDAGCFFDMFCRWVVLAKTQQN